MLTISSPRTTPASRLFQWRSRPVIETVALLFLGPGSVAWLLLAAWIGPTDQSDRLDVWAATDIDFQVEQATMKRDKMLKSSSCNDLYESKEEADPCESAMFSAQKSNG